MNSTDAGQYREASPSSLQRFSDSEKKLYQRQQQNDLSVSTLSRSKADWYCLVHFWNSSQVVVNLMVSFKKMAIGTLMLPLCSMFICFVSAYIFQNDQIHETHCRVYNIIPSISAITGISPQRYLWRVSIAVHAGPRFLVAFAYRSYYNYILAQATSDTVIKASDVVTAKRLIHVCFWLSITEISALLGVTYISNRENYRKWYLTTNTRLLWLTAKPLLRISLSSNSRKNFYCLHDVFSSLYDLYHKVIAYFVATRPTIDNRRGLIEMEKNFLLHFNQQHHRVANLLCQAQILVPWHG